MRISILENLKLSFKELIKKTYKNILFTTPSHAQKFPLFHKFRHFYKYDVSETDTHAAEDMLTGAEKYATKIYGTKQTKFLINGSTSGIIAAVLSVVNRGDNVLIWKNAHRCHLNAVKLAGGNPIFYDLPINDFGVAGGFENPEKYITKDIKAVIITSPTYEGYVSDIKEIKEVCKKNNTYLIVDEAHGALYPFSDELPESAIQYADFTVQSLHKTAGGLNPTALLHVNCDIDLKLDMITTTSPSYPLLMTIEHNIRFLASNRGKKEIKNLISNIKNLRKDLPGYKFGGDDITKILIKKQGLTGEELSEQLYNMGIEDEKTNPVSTMLLTGIGTKKDKLEKLKLALKKIAKN